MSIVKFGLQQWSLKNDPDNSHYQYSVAVVQNETAVGHVPRDGHRGFHEIASTMESTWALKYPVSTDSMVALID
jgi:hypothetical protein